MSLREMDSIIAEQVMGWHKVPVPAGYGIEWMWDKREGCRWNEVQECPRYSVDIARAWQVLETLPDACVAKYEGGWICTNLGSDFWYAADFSAAQFEEAFSAHCFIGRADTAPLAICRAALHAARLAAPATP